MQTIQWEIVLIGAAVIMAAINFLKDVLQGRALFNAFVVDAWLARGREGKGVTPDDRVDFNLRKARRELIKLAAGGRDSSLYRLPINQLAGQINAAAETVLDFPADHRDLFMALCSQSDRDVLRFLQFSDGFRAEYVVARDGIGPGTKQDLMDARARLTSLMQRRIDDLQIFGRATWRLLLQVVALGFGFFLMPFLNSGNLRVFFGSVLAAGFLAPVLHDLLTALTNRRGGA
jgi:hypothetical protein